jgi:hypothetical protein
MKYGIGMGVNQSQGLNNSNLGGLYLHARKRDLRIFSQSDFISDPNR